MRPLYFSNELQNTEQVIAMLPLDAKDVIVIKYSHIMECYRLKNSTA